eukprot:COSAG02_NODE_30110_length_557_cov_0.657205_2_plen_55_part_01
MNPSDQILHSVADENGEARASAANHHKPVPARAQLGIDNDSLTVGCDDDSCLTRA